MTAQILSSPAAAPPAPALAWPARITSIDAMRGFVMFLMIVVNDLVGISHTIIPWWMKHYAEMQPPPVVRNGMTFVDLIFPAFLFIVGMSIPFALGKRLQKGEPWHHLLMHVILRTLSLLLLEVLLVNGTPTARLIGYSGTLWVVLMFAAVILTFCQIAPFWLRKDDARAQLRWRRISIIIRAISFSLLILLTLSWRKSITSADGHEQIHRIVSFSPFFIEFGWWEILGRIGWAYLIGSLAFLIFRYNRLALSTCVTLLLGLWIAQAAGSFRDFQLPGILAPVGNALIIFVSSINQVVEIGETLGSRSAITVAGVLLATILITPETSTSRSRIRFTLWFIAATALAAMIFFKPYLIWKNNATPAFCLWACCLTAAVWLLFFIAGDVLKWNWLTRPCAIAGQNVLLAYLLSRAFKPCFVLLGISEWYGNLGNISLASALTRSIVISVLLLTLTAALNRAGFRLKL